MKLSPKSSIALFAVVAVATMIACSSSIASGQPIVVTANPLWTDTGIAVATTDVVQIYGATGAWKAEVNVPFAGPDGSIRCDLVWDEWISDAHSGQLIGFVGSNPNNTNVVIQNSPALFVVSTNSVTFTGKAGELWLGFNDAFASRYPSNQGVNDNSGSVTVTVARATLPQSLGISFGGPDIQLSIPIISSNLYSYTIQTTTDLVSGAWSTIGSNLTSTGSVMTNYDVDAAAFSQRFYRMAIQATPPQAADNAADLAYNCGWVMSIFLWNGTIWTNGITGGAGFGPWELTTTGVIGSSSNGFFIGSSTNNASGLMPGIDVGGRSWGMYADSNSFAVAYRAFAGGPLQVGQTFLIDMDNGFIDTNDSVGLVIRSGNASSNPSNYGVGARFEFLFLGGDPSNSYKVVDAQGMQNVGVPFTGTGLHLVFTLNTTNTYTLLTIDNASNATNIFTGTLGGVTNSSLNSVALFNFNAGNGSNHACYFNSMSVANPAPVYYTVGTSSLPTAGGSSGGGGTVAAGSNVTVCAVVNPPCYGFVGWLDESNNVVSTAPCYSFTVQTNRNLMANFALLTDTVGTSSSPSGGGSTSGGGTVNCGSDVTVCATANVCYGFVSWTDQSSNVVSMDACYDFTVNGNFNLVANFGLLTNTVNTSSSPAAGGSTSGGGAVACGSNVTVCATTNAGYGFVNWTDQSSNVLSTAACFSFTANTSTNLVANFSH